MTLPTAPDDLAFFAYTPQDREVLAELAETLEKHADALVAAFYRHLLSVPETRRLLRDPEVTQRLLGMQRRYLLSLAGPKIDDEYLANRRRIGEIHERIGLEPRWYLGAYALYLTLLNPLMAEWAQGDLERFQRAATALNKLLLIDVHLAMEAYIDRRERDLEYLNSQLAASSRELADDLQKTGVELRQTTERARHAERLASIGTLVAGLAHEIGTPMGVIQGHARLLEPAVTGDKARWRLRTIEEQITRISRIIQSLLNMARPGKRRKAPVELAPLVENTLAFLGEKFQRRQIEVVPALEPRLSVSGDSEQLQQLLLNLFLNAADAMPDGGTLRIALTTGVHGDAVVRVSDTGHGIPDGDLDRVFEPFYTTKASGEGSGLGLAVAQGIAAEHDGEMELLHSDRTGTEFEVRLPLIRSGR